METITLFSITVSIWLVGGMFGAGCGSWIANKFGRRDGLLLTQALSLSGATLMGCSKVEHMDPRDKYSN